MKTCQCNIPVEILEAAKSKKKNHYIFLDIFLFLPKTQIVGTPRQFERVPTTYVLD